MQFIVCCQIHEMTSSTMCLKIRMIEGHVEVSITRLKYCCIDNIFYRCANFKQKQVCFIDKSAVESTI